MQAQNLLFPVNVCQAATEQRLKRRLSDLLHEAAFLLVQLMMLHQSGGPHHHRDRGQRIATLHRKLDQVEHHLRMHATDLGIEQGLTLSQVRRRLAQHTDSRQSAEGYHGPERRRGERRQPMRFQE